MVPNATATERWLRELGIDLNDGSRQKLMNIAGDLNDLTLFFFITREDIDAIFEGYPLLKLRMIQSAFQSLTVESNYPKKK